MKTIVKKCDCTQVLYMDFRDNIKDAKLMDEEVVHFEVYSKGYYAILQRGSRLDIQRVFHIQPPIDDKSDYFAYMFAETQQGFYLMRQRVFENKTENWVLCLELIPEESHRFFTDAHAYWWSIREKLAIQGGKGE